MVVLVGVVVVVVVVLVGAAVVVVVVGAAVVSAAVVSTGSVGVDTCSSSPSPPQLVATNPKASTKIPTRNSSAAPRFVIAHLTRRYHTTAQLLRLRLRPAQTQPTVTP